MKSHSVKAVVILVAMGLIIFCVKSWAADWKEFVEASTGVFDYDAANISSPSQGFVRVWIHNVTKNETTHLEINCKDKVYRVLDVIQYDEANRIKGRQTYYDHPAPTWYKITPNSVPESLYSIVCP